MRAISYAPVSRIPSGVRKNFFGQLVQDAAIDEYRRALLLPFGEARYDRLLKMRDLIDRMIAWIERRLYGEKQ